MSEEATEMLREACTDSSGMILSVHHDGGRDFQTNGHAFVKDGSPRSQALWKAAFDQLLGSGLIEARGHKNEVFQVTHEGYRVGDSL